MNQKDKDTLGFFLKSKRFFADMSLQDVVDELSKYDYQSSTTGLNQIERDQVKKVDIRLCLILSKIYDFKMKELEDILKVEKHS
ncbi:MULTISPECIES: hypothetical protein [Lactobacillaceae]|uniref:hypothetical protein n=1 Tax=Lactobacillaceae TaxID=33958 RepID=UPI000C1B6F23|nr:MULTISPECIES: hypothetical protein [Lactobacillaceae]